MNCEECVELLTPLLYEELSDDQSLEVFEHMSECENCRLALEEAVNLKNKLSAALGGKPEIDGLSDEHKQTIMSSLTQKDPLRPPKAFPSWVFALAACIVIGLIVAVSIKPDKPYSLAKAEEPGVVEVGLNEEELEKKSNFSAPAKRENVSNFKDQQLQEGKIAEADMSFEATDRLEKSTVSKKEKVKNVLGGRSRKMQPTAELKSVKDDAVSLTVPVVAVKIDKIREMFLEYEKQADLSEEQMSILTKLKSLKNDQLEVVDIGVDKGLEKTSQKILIRILNKAGNALDYAYIFVHNQNIIHVERVR